MIIFQFFESERLVLIDNESDGVEAKSDWPTFKRGDLTLNDWLIGTELQL